MGQLRILFFLLLGLVVGGGLGLYLGWEVWPIQFTDADPSFLADSYRQDYVRMVAGSYALEGDLATAEADLGRLGSDWKDLLTAVTLDAILQQQAPTDIQHLVNLATAFGISSPAMVPYLPPATEPNP